MFGIIADLLSSITTIILPAYLSYKALRSHDPAQTQPWLIYFTTLSLALLAESWTLFIIGWLPFYSWFRLFFLLYLVLPQTQGAKILYLQYLEPFIVRHEAHIDDFITETHQRLQQMGLGYVNTLIEFLREKVLGQKSPQEPRSAQGYSTYAHDLLSRFSMPQARDAAAGDGGGLYGMVSGFAGAAMSGRARDPATEAVNVSDSLVRDLRGPGGAEKTTAIAVQRERLTAILNALETEQRNIDLASSSGAGLNAAGMKTKSRSEQSFEKVDYEEAADAGRPSLSPKHSNQRSTSGSWMPSGVTGWFGGGDSHAEGKSSTGWSAAKDITDAMAEATSSGVDRNRMI